jgi:cytochrome c biogenesis protein CcmG/thiol:disulfide interchange protein DsbE
MRSMDPEPTDESLGRPGGSSWLAIAVMGVASVFLAVVVVSLAGALLSVGGDVPEGPTPEEHPAIGQKLARLDLEPLMGADEPVTLDDLAGKVVLVNFWGPWCQPCWIELPHVAKLGKDLGDRTDFKLLAVSCGKGFPEDAEDLRIETATFLRQSNIDVPTYSDPDGTTRSAFQALAGLNVFPTTFLMDRQGVLRGIWPGYAPGIEEEMAELVERLLEE